MPTELIEEDLSSPETVEIDPFFCDGTVTIYPYRPPDSLIRPHIMDIVEKHNHLAGEAHVGAGYSNAARNISWAATKGNIPPSSGDTPGKDQWLVNEIALSFIAYRSIILDDVIEKYDDPSHFFETLMNNYGEMIRPVMKDYIHENAL